MDLLDKLNKKPAEGSAEKAEPGQQAQASAEFDRGEDLLAKANGSEAAAKEVNAGDSKESAANASSKEEPSGSDMKDPTSWDDDSKFKEIKKLREENKAYRLKYSEQLDKLREDSETRIKEKESELATFMDAKKELDKIKSEQEDKKRDLNEKLAHREAKLAEYQILIDARESEFKAKLAEMENKVHTFEADRQAEAQVHQNRLDEELSKIPENFREYASLIVKGSGDPRDALIALTEAKLKGMFEDKKVVVNHSVPNAYEGARSSKERLDEAGNEARKSRTSQDKIKSALDKIRSGTPNSAYRGK
jgi:chromosome segregation ATPase